MGKESVVGGGTISGILLDVHMISGDERVAFESSRVYSLVKRRMSWFGTLKWTTAGRWSMTFFIVGTKTCHNLPTHVDLNIYLPLDLSNPHPTP